MENIGLEAVFKDAGFNQGINKYNGSVDTANKKTSGLANTVKTAAGKIPILGSAMSLLTNPITLVTSGLGALIGVTVKSVNEVVSYNKTIREMTLVTGLGSDEISRIVQVGDDWGVSTGDIRSALQMMNKKGITPSIDNLAILADEYVAATDKSKFMEEATKKYGRSVTALIPLLAEGGDSFRDQTASIADNMIATEENIDSSREYEVAMDNLGDTVQGLKNELGNGLIPALVEVLGVVNDLTSRVTSEKSAWDKLKKAHEAGLITQGELTTSYLKLSSGIWDAEDASKFLADKVTALEARMADGGNEMERYNRLFGDLQGKVVIARAAFIPLTFSVADNKEAMWDNFNALQQLNDEQEASKTSIDNMTAAYDALVLMMDDPLATEMNDFITLQEGVELAMKDVHDQIDILNGQEILTPEQQAELDGLQSEYTTLKGQYEENARVHRQKTAEIIIDLALQAIAASGLSEDIKTKLYAQLTAVAENWGITDTAALTAMTAIQGYLTGAEPSIVGFGSVIYGIGAKFGIWGDNIGTAKQKASDLALLIDGLDGKVSTIIIDIIKTEYEQTVQLPPGWHQGDPYPYMAEGGPVSAGQSYIVGERGMEMFVPSTNGMIIPNSMMSNYSVSTNNNRNVNVNIGGVSIHNGADHQAFISQVEWAVQRALGV